MLMSWDFPSKTSPACFPSEHGAEHGAEPDDEYDAEHGTSLDAEHGAETASLPFGSTRFLLLCASSVGLSFPL